MIIPILFGMLLFTSCQSATNIHEEELITALSTALGTPYVGNVSAVSEIVQALPIPQDGWRQRFMSIGDDCTPYALTVYYEPANSSTTAVQAQEMPIDAFEKNAAFLFDHIGNLEKVIFAVRQTPSDSALDISAYEHHWAITRNYAP